MRCVICNMDTKTFLCFLITVQSSVAIQAQLSEHCQDSELRCQDGVCVDFHYSCDTDAECFRVSDMRVSRVPISNVRTPFRSLCKKNEFDCYSGRCVPLNWLCDTAEDCENGFDENDCLAIPNNCPADLIQPYRRLFKMNNIKNVTLSCKTCISSGPMNVPLKLAIYPTKSVLYVNVGETVVLQCRDEGALRTPVRWLREDRKPFTVGTFIQPRGRLEMITAVPADSGGYICQAPLYSGSPGSEARVDIVVGSSDPDIRKRRFVDMEQECYENQFQCVSDKVCFPLKWRCDGDVDCYDGSDEQNCFVQSSN